MFFCQQSATAAGPLGGRLHELRAAEFSRAAAGSAASAAAPAVKRHGRRHGRQHALTTLQ